MKYVVSDFTDMFCISILQFCRYVNNNKTCPCHVDNKQNFGMDCTIFADYLDIIVISRRQGCSDFTAKQYVGFYYEAAGGYLL